ncbi:MAG TPA: tRNA (guanine-N7)-methyltransferase [Polyangiaceae bacterium]|jgi:tRNA (guanine-N7-)-methyltransferase|nr:tRNA (guanine-N7)-methyltransferase [Polyangiaceae bacterium]
MTVRPYADAPRLPEGDAIDPRALVGAGEAPIELEIGPGRGGFLFERLGVDPGIRMVGLEIRRKWASIVDARLKARGLGQRARVFAEDARDALPRFVPGSIRVVHLHFPDPWWKKRHQKRLVLGLPLLQRLSRVLCAGGELFVQTDVEERAKAYEELLGGSAEFEVCGESARVDENPFLARSPREHRAIADGLPIYRLYFRVRSLPSGLRALDPSTPGLLR